MAFGCLSVSLPLHLVISYTETAAYTLGDFFYFLFHFAPPCSLQFYERFAPCLCFTLQLHEAESLLKTLMAAVTLQQVQICIEIDTFVACQWIALSFCQWIARIVLSSCQWIALSSCQWIVLSSCQWIVLSSCQWITLSSSQTEISVPPRDSQVLNAHLKRESMFQSEISR
jgi:hypothetical protein